MSFDLYKNKIVPDSASSAEEKAGKLAAADARAAFMAATFDELSAALERTGLPYALTVQRMKTDGQDKITASLTEQPSQRDIAAFNAHYFNLEKGDAADLALGFGISSGSYQSVLNPEGRNISPVGYFDVRLREALAKVAGPDAPARLDAEAGQARPLQIAEHRPIIPAQFRSI